MGSIEMDEFVSQVRERSDIYSVVSRYVTLNLKSGKYWACCPFHEEKTASFSVSPDKGMFYCFGCHVGGNVFKFISLMEHVTYFEAVKLQAERLGIDIPSRHKSPEELKIEEGRQSLFQITSLAQEFYYDCLTKTAEGAAGRKYLNSRGITDAVIKRFKLGFAPDSWNALTKELQRRGFSDEQLIQSGVAIKKKVGTGINDRLRGRVIIPIADINGRVVAFGGRIFKSSGEHDPKYINTSETEIFSKGKLLFGLDKAKRAITATNTAIVVEGYMDAISLASEGIENVVASLGTAFTSEQAKLLTRYAKRIIFCYDSDAAGQRATMRALPIMRNAGSEVFVIIVPDGKDPDEFIRKYGKKDFERLIKDATPLISYQIKYVLSHSDCSTFNGKINALREILPMLAEVKDVILKNAYCKEISAVLALDENVIHEQLRNFLRHRKLTNISDSKNTLTNDSISQYEAEVIKTIWTEVELVKYVLSLVNADAFTKIHREIISYLEKCYVEDRQPDDISATVELSDEANLELSRILISEMPDSDARIQAFEDALKSIKRSWLKNQYNKMIQEADRYFKSGDDANYEDKMRLSLKIQTEITKLENN